MFETRDAPASPAFEWRSYSYYTQDWRKVGLWKAETKNDATQIAYREIGEKKLWCALSAARWALQ